MAITFLVYTPFSKISDTPCFKHAYCLIQLQVHGFLTKYRTLHYLNITYCHMTSSKSNEFRFTHPDFIVVFNYYNEY